MTISAKIVATGSYLPEKILTNHDLSKMVDTDDAWITERTGIKQRRIAEKNQLTSDLACLAYFDLVKNHHISAQQIEAIIVATTTPDLTFPATATTVQAKIGASKAFAFDVSAVCSGFVYALTIANALILAKQVKNVLVIGAETMSRIVDWQDRNTCVLFGDGAGCVFLEASNQENVGILSSNLNSDGTLNHLLQTNGGPSFNGSAGYVTMQGKEVFKHAVDKMTQSVLTTLTQIGLSTNDIDLLIPHQANLRILQGVMHKLQLPQEKVIITVQDHANTSAASIPLALDFACKNNRIKKNDLVVLEALGGGLTWGSMAIRW
jgi:3-oxoacyl-[acyl-carrier-protein] synthase-3